MEKLFFTLVASIAIFFSTAIYADASQQVLPGTSAPAGVPDQKNAILPTIKQSGIKIDTGGIGPNTVPNNVNTNGTVNVTPGNLQELNSGNIGIKTR